VPTVVLHGGEDWLFLPWLAVANSFVMDALVRRMLSSPHMTFTVLDGLPFPRPALDDAFVIDVALIVLRLICTSPEMTAFWNAMASHALCEAVDDDSVPESALLLPVDRALARAELDALVAMRVYGLCRDELSDALDTFGVLQRREVKERGEYVTKRLVLDAYDRLR